jgi:signal transduction histidine kinase
MDELHNGQTAKPWRQWGVFAVAIVLFQVAYWFVLSPQIGHRTAIPASGFVTEMSHAVLAKAELQTVAALPEDQWETVQPGWFSPSSQPHHAFRFTLTLQTEPTEDIGLIAGIGADNFHIFVNGHALANPGRVGEAASYHSRRMRGVERVPAAMLVEGDNQFLILVTRRSPGYIDLFPSAWGDYAALREATARRSFMVNEYRNGVMVLFALVGGFALIVAPFARNKAFPVWLGMLSLALSAREFERSWATPPWSPDVVTTLYFAIGIIAAAAWFNLLDAWTGRGWPWARRLVSALAGILVAISAFAIFNRGTEGFDIAGIIMDSWWLVAGLAAAALFVWRLARTGAERPWEAAALLVGITALVVDAMSQLTQGRSLNHMMFAMPYLLAAVTAAILARNVRIYDSMGALNDDLARKLAQREAEMAEYYERQRAAQRYRDLNEERQRIMRDMHDGLGSQLMSLLLAARRGRVDPEQLSEGLQAVIDEMRLMIHSMDSVGESLAVALATFQERILPRVDAAGFELEWRNDAEGNLPDLGPRAVLQVFRILQEAVNNALRHSGGNRLAVRILREVDGGVSFHVEDNGVGMTPDARRGRGLDNMAVRAAGLGGSVLFEDAAPGTRVVLRVSRPLGEPQ